MKVREDSYETMTNNFCREYYFGCYIEVFYYADSIDQHPTQYVGRVLVIEPQHLTALLVRRATEDDEELPSPWTWDSEANESSTKSFRRLSDQEYMVRKMQGFFFPENLI